MRARFVMTDTQYFMIVEACRPCIEYIDDTTGGTALRPDYRKVNAAWIALGDVLGFDAGTVMPLENDRTFSAEVIVPATKAD